MRRMVRFCSDKGMRTRVGRIKVDQVRKGEDGIDWNLLRYRYQMSQIVKNVCFYYYYYNGEKVILGLIVGWRIDRIFFVYGKGFIQRDLHPGEGGRKKN